MASHALLFGFNTPGLSFAAADALRLGEVLEQRGYKCSTVSKADTGINLLNRIMRFCDKRAKADELLFFFSGHGLVEMGELRLITNENRYDENLHFGDVLRFLQRSRAGQKLIVLDCCHSGAGAIQLPLDALSEGLRLLTSSRMLEPSKELSLVKAGALTWLLTDSLTARIKEIVDRDGVVRINALHADVQQRAREFNLAGTETVAIPNLFGNASDDFAVIRIHAAELQSIRSEIEAARKADWGTAPDLRPFFGRENELGELGHWLLVEKAKLVAIVGIRGVGKTQLSVGLTKGGIGKTDLTRQLAVGVQSEYQFVFWRSLLNSPPLTRILGEFLTHVRGQGTPGRLPETSGELIDLTLGAMQKSRCLLVLDNYDTVLGTSAPYALEREDYGVFVAAVADASHHSTVLITSRETPPEFDFHANNNRVKQLNLGSLSVDDAKQIFAQHGKFAGTENQWIQLVTFYKGNPLALGLVALHIKAAFNEDIGRFISEGKELFDNLKQLLKWHWNRLDSGEREIALWLAINREPIAMDALNEDVLSSSRDHLPSSLTSLRRKVPLETGAGSLSFQPVLIEFLTDEFVSIAVNEINESSIGYCASHAFVKATAKDFVREAQERLILREIRDKLLAQSDPCSLEERILKILPILRSDARLTKSYAAGNLLNLLCCLQTKTRAYDFSRLAIWQAFLQGLELHNINFSFSDLGRSVFTETLGGVLTLAFRADGKALVSGDSGNTVSLWEMPAGVKVASLRGHQSWVRSVDFSPSGKMIASVGEDLRLIIWSSEGKLLHSVENVHPRMLRAVRFIDESTVATAGGDGYVRLWKIGPEVSLLREGLIHQTGIRALAWNFKERTLATGGDDYVVRLCSVDDLKISCETRVHSGAIRALAFSPDGAVLASGSDDNRICLLDASTLAETRELKGHTNQIRALAFDAGGSRLASASYDATVRVWNLCGDCILTLQQREYDRLWSVVFSPNGECLVTGSLNKSIRIWSTKQGELLRTLQGYSNAIKGAAWCGKNQFATGSDDGCVRLWSEYGEQCLETKDVHQSLVLSVAGSDVSNAVASASDDNAVGILDATSFELKRKLESHKYAVTAVAFSQNGQSLFSGGLDRRVIKWDTTTLQLACEWEAGGRIWSVDVSKNDQVLAVSCENGVVHFLDPATLKEKARISCSDRSIWRARWSSDSSRLLICREGLPAQVVTFAANAPLIESTLDRTLSDGTILSNGSMIIGAASEGTVCFWDAESLHLLNEVKNHSSRVWSLAVNREETMFVTASEDETVSVWSVRSASVVRTIAIPRPYEGMKIAGVQGLTDAQKETLLALGAIA